MPLTPGSRIGGYEIVSALGAGGMGEVYRARDARLARDVAIKVLPERLAADPDALARFEREAKAVAALSHPNILGIFDFGSSDGTAFAVMELLEGETLRDRLASGALPPRKAVDYAAQVASGLATAHDKGIVHRDLKPENLFLTRDGRVKVLDFGLARQAATVAAPGETSTPTVSRHTDPGTMLGTVGYMAPEQVRGAPADARSDIFGLGAVLYELVSGRRAFPGETAADCLSAILREDPAPLSDGQPGLAAIDRIVRRCLEKNPGERFQSARDLAFALTGLQHSSGAAAAGAGPEPSRRRGLPVGLILVGAAALAAGLVTGRRWSANGEARAGLDGIFKPLTDAPGVESSPSLSPDGKTLLYVAGLAAHRDVFAQRVGGHNPINLTQDFAGNDDTPAFSPDGERIVFRSARDNGGIFVMGSTGESVRRLTDGGFHPSWSPDGKQIVYATVGFTDPLRRARNTSTLVALSLDTGDKRPLETGGDAVQPRWSPHGHRIAYWGLRPDRSNRDIWTIAAGGGDVVEVTSEPSVDWSPVWAPDGESLYFVSDRGGTMNLWRVAIDERTGRTAGPPQPLTTPTEWVSGISISGDGRQIAFATEDRRSSLWSVDFDPERGAPASVPRAILEGSRLISAHHMSPDGQSIVFATGGLREDLFLIRTDGTGYRQLTDDAFRDRVPQWSPDGRRIAFYSNRSGSGYRLWSIHPDGSGLERLSDATLLFPCWSPDGARIAATDLSKNFILTVAGPEKGALETLPPMEHGAFLFPTSWSADGRTIAGFAVGTDGLLDGIHLYDLAGRSFKAIARDAGPATWLRDSRRLLYRSPAGLAVYDSRTGALSTLLPRLAVVEPSLFSFAFEVSASRDDRLLSYVQTTIEGDVWMFALK